MNILFVVPMHITFESFITPGPNSRQFTKSGRKFNSLSTDLPIGVMSLSAYLKKHIDVHCKLIDFNAEINSMSDFDYSNFHDCALDQFKKSEYKPDVVCISSLFSPSFLNFMEAGKAAREIWPDALHLGGGNIPTNSYKDIYSGENQDTFDALCYGEGEKSLLELLTCSDRESYLRKSQSWITKDKIISSDLYIPKHNFIEDLDEIPFLDYGLCSLEKHAINQNLSSFHVVENPRGFHIMTSRGCPYLCTFCASHKTHGRKMRYHSIERVQEDLTRLKNIYQADTVVFQDDHLMADQDRVYKLLEIVGNLKLNSLYQNGLTLYALDRPMLQAFYDAGVRHLVLPVESGSEKVLKQQMKKPLKTRISKRVAQDCRELGIYTNVNILIGMPGETKADLEEGRLNLREITGNWFNIACASPLVGSEMYALALAKGYISLKNMGSDYHVATINTEDFSSDFIQDFQYKLNLELNFVFNQDIKLGEYRIALLGMNNVIRLRSDHAFAHYYAYICHKGLGDHKASLEDARNYNKYAQSSFWNKYVLAYNLPKEILLESLDSNGADPEIQAVEKTN